MMVMMEEKMWLKSLLELIPQLIDRGYKLVTVEQLWQQLNASTIRMVNQPEHL